MHSRIIRGGVRHLLTAAALLLLGPAVARAQNPVTCDFDIPDNRGTGVTGKIMYVVGRAGSSSSRGSFYITNGNTPAGDDDLDGYGVACDFNNLFVSLRGNLTNVDNPSLAIPGQNIIVSNLNPKLPSGEEEQPDVEVEIPQGSPAGRYRGFITIRDNVIGAVPNSAGEILNLDLIYVEVEVLPTSSFSIVNPDSAVALDSVVVPARAGDRGEGVFRIANTGNTPLNDVQISATDLRSESAVGLIIPVANITFSVSSFAGMAISDTERVTVIVQVPRGILGGRYRGTILVQARDAAPARIPLIVVVTSSRGILFENNPVRAVNGDIARIAFNGDPGTVYKLAIFDMDGLLVYTTEGTVFAGVGGTAQQPGPGADYAVSVSWPLVNGVGEQTVAGVYLVVVESVVNGQRQLAKDKLIVIR